MQKISYLTGWNYEYVYASFSECYTMLANGEIDLFGNVSYTPERAELFNFSSYPQGKDTYWLYVNKNQSSLADGDVDAIVAPDLATDYDYLLSLINDVLDISRIESGNISYDPEPVNITAVTDSVLDITHGFTINHDLQLIVHRDEPETHYVLADEVRLREILINIISNAVKFTHDGGRITFETFRKPGTAPDNIIFGYRISDTGIGMAITKRYVELMGGTITVESTKGKGTTFTVELPLTLAVPIEKREAYTAPVQKRTTDLHVLMAEDNDLNAEIATMLLEDEGMHVTRAADGCEVVEMFKSHPASTYDVILMDIMMPRMNGYEATRTIRSLSDRPDGGTIPIIAMTANAFAEDVVKCKEAWMDSHLPKPFKADQLIASIIAPKN
ncbi:MAG: response regulator [Suilimivivens sp.]